MKRGKSLMLTAVLVLFSLALTGCFSTRNAIIFDGDWQAYIGMDVITDDFGPSEEELKDIVARLQLFFPEFSQVEAGKKRISYVSDRKIGIEELKFVEKQTLEDGTEKITINLPPLITAKDYQGEAKGASMILELYVPGTVVEANTFDFDNNHVMQRVFLGEKRARVVWQLSKEHLSSPLRLWVTVKPTS